MTGLRYPPFVRPGAAISAPASARLDELPSIDEFIDELPPIEEFLADFASADSADHEGEREVPEAYAEERLITPSHGLPAVSEEGWARGDWQSYDWSSLAALNRQNPGHSGADDSWGENDWPGESGQSASELDSSVTPGAAEIADALDGIARRIRSGELVLDNLHGTRPEAAMAAALAVLFRMRG
jgi:hypothetical protein